MPGGGFGSTGIGTLGGVRPGRAIVTALKYINTDPATRFLQIFDAADGTGIVLGTTKPIFVLSAGASGESSAIIDDGLVFEKGIAAVVTTTATGSGLGGSTSGHIFAVIN